MSEEEKEAINLLKSEILDSEKLFEEVGCYKFFNKDRINAVKVILNLIEKQKEAIKELNLENQAFYEEMNCNDNEYISKKYSQLKENSISKDKIKEILDLAYKDNYEMVKLPNNDFMCVSDCENLLDYLKELVEEK